MLVSDAAWFGFAVFSGLRIFSYIPQIVRVARDRDGASATLLLDVVALDRRECIDCDICRDQSQRYLARIREFGLWIVLHRCDRRDDAKAVMPKAPRRVCTCFARGRTSECIVRNAAARTRLHEIILPERRTSAFGTFAPYRAVAR
jgi:hypothetical protein